MPRIVWCAMLDALLAAPLDQGTAHFQPSTLEISTIDIGNPATNVIPGQARAVFNIRYNDNWSSATIETWLRAEARSAGARPIRSRDPGQRRILPGAAGRSQHAPDASAITRVTNRTPELSTTGGTSDARFIHRFCPVAEFGMVGQTMHKADESVPVADLRA